MIIDLERGEVIAMLDTRDPEEVQKVLDRYPNLETISRDRGATYKVLCPDCAHVVDRFHLVLNLSEAIQKEMMDYLPRYVRIADERLPLREAEESEPALTGKQKQKMDLILEIQAKHQQGKGFRALAREYHLSRQTVKRYAKATDAADASIYHTQKKQSSYLDPYVEGILRVYAETKSIKAVKAYLEEKGIRAPYQSVRRYITKYTDEKAEGSIMEDGETKIRRQDILRFLFDWNYKGAIDDHLDVLVSRYPAIGECKRFYREFRQNLTGLDPVALINQLSCPHEAPCLNGFIASLRKDWEGLLNAASYAISNGIAEGTVNRIKQVKRDMYGRAGIDLLRKKVMYQSHPITVV